AALVEERRRAVDAEAALAGAHPEPHGATHIIEVRRARRDRRLDPVARDQLALAEELAVAGLFLDLRQRLAGPEEPTGARLRRDWLGRLQVRAAGRRHAEAPRREVHRALGHQAVGRVLPADDRDEALHACALLVVEQREVAADVAVPGPPVGA